MSYKNLNKYIIFFLGLLALLLLIKYAMGNGDFKVFLEASKLVMSGQNPYNKWIFVSEESSCLYFYSPLCAITLSPFSYFPNFIPNLLWLIANVYFLYRIWNLLSLYLDENSLSGKQIKWIYFLTILMSVRFALYNFEMIQMTIFLLWGCLESLRLINQKNYLSGSFLLALIINIKIMPIVLIPYLIYRSQYKGAIFTLLFSILLLFLPALFLGWSHNQYLLTEWWSVINPSNPEHLLETELGPHSLTALIPTLLSETKGVLPYTRNILNLPINTSIYIMNFIRIILIISSLYFLKWPPFTPAKSKIYKLREIGFILLIIPLLFPHQQKYAFILALPAMYFLSWYIVFNFRSHRLIMKQFRWNIFIFFIIASFVLMTLTTDSLIGRNLNNLTQHYKTITWGTLFLLFSLFLAPISKSDDTPSSSAASNH